MHYYIFMISHQLNLKKLPTHYMIWIITLHKVEQDYVMVIHNTPKQIESYKSYDCKCQ